MNATITIRNQTGIASLKLDRTFSLDREVRVMDEGMLAVLSLVILFGLFLFAFIRYLKWVKKNQAA